MRSATATNEKSLALKKRINDFKFENLPESMTASEKNSAHFNLLYDAIKDPDCDESLYQRILETNIVRAEIKTDLSGKISSIKGKTTDTIFQNEYNARAIIASSPHTKLNVLDTIFNKSNNSWDVLSAIARNRNCSADLLDKIYKSASSFKTPWCHDEVIRGVLMSPIASESLLRKILSNTKYPEEIRAIAYAHTNMPLPDDATLKNLSTTSLSRLADNPNCNGGYLKKIIELKNCDKGLCKKILETLQNKKAPLDSELLSIIARKTDDPSIIISQINHKNALLGLASDNTHPFDIKSVRAIVNNPHCDTKILTALLLNKNTSLFLGPSGLEKIANDVSDDDKLNVFQAIALHKNTNLTTLKMLAEKSTNQETLINVLGHPKLQSQQDPDGNTTRNEIINLVLNNPNISAAHILSAASNKNASAETLQRVFDLTNKLKTTDRDSIFPIIASHKNTDKATLSAIAENTESILALTTLLENKNFTDVTAIKKMMDTNSKRPKSLNALDIKMTLAFAKNQNTDLDLLHEIAIKSRSMAVLMAVATHENTNAELLKYSYQKKECQNDAMRLAIAKNKNADAVTLEKILAESKSLDVYDAVVSNPNYDAALLEKASHSNGGSFFKKTLPDDQVLLNIVKHPNTGENTLQAIAKKTKNSDILKAITEHHNWKPEFSRTIVLPVQHYFVTSQVVKDKTTDFKMLNEIGYQALIAFKAKKLHPDTLADIWMAIINNPKFNPGSNNNQQEYSFTKLLEFISTHAELSKEKHNQKSFNALCEAMVKNENTPKDIILQIQKINPLPEFTTSPGVRAVKDELNKTAASFEQGLFSPANQQTMLTQPSDAMTKNIINDLERLKKAISETRTEIDIVKSLCTAAISFTINTQSEKAYLMFLASQFAKCSEESLSLGVTEFCKERKMKPDEIASLMAIVNYEKNAQVTPNNPEPKLQR